MLGSFTRWTSFLEAVGLWEAPRNVLATLGKVIFSAAALGSAPPPHLAVAWVSPCLRLFGQRRYKSPGYYILREVSQSRVSMTSVESRLDDGYIDR